ncbi:putative beta-defensin 109B [Mesocricetus auratus]|uniref:Beta-defensin 109B n=1 Tax=Mesocricetus auratus TaxID=10036 RepID=A0A1U7QV34_MESAU|nr:putative beta-defensin 109B [Mesocricetus auratus]
MRFHLLLHILLFLLAFLPPVRSGLGAAETHCLNLEGTCRRDICKVVEDEIGACRRRWKCCRFWWILVPIPTPVIFSDYQEPVKTKLK